MTATPRTALALVLAATTLVACVPRAGSLPGTGVAPARIPAGALPPGHRLVQFRWELTEGELLVRGDGAARVASPDSARLDFFLAGGLGGGRAVLLGDSLVVPAEASDLATRLVPPAPMLWATLGRLAIPATSDTAAAVDGDLLRADFGDPAAWRVTFRGDSLVRVERIADGRVAEWLARDGTTVRYRHEPSRRELRLTVTRTQPSPPFDAAIWRP